MREYWVNVYTSYISTINHFSREDAIEGSRSIYSGEQLASYRIHVIPKLPKAPQLETGYQREVIGNFEDDKYKYQIGKDWASVEDKLPGPSPFPFNAQNRYNEYRNWNKLTENKDILDTLFPTDD